MRQTPRFSFMTTRSEVTFQADLFPSFAGCLVQQQAAFFYGHLRSRGRMRVSRMTGVCSRESIATTEAIIMKASEGCTECFTPLFYGGVCCCSF